MEIFLSLGIIFWIEKQSISDKKLVELNDQKCNKLMKNCDKYDGNGVIDDVRYLFFLEFCEVQKDLSDNEMFFYFFC